MRETTENGLYKISDNEIAVIHALAFYAPDGMTAEADKIRHNIMETLNLHRGVGKIKVWK